VTELSKSRLGRVLVWLMTRQLECDVNEDEEAESCACSRPGELGPYRGSILPELGRRRTVCVALINIDKKKRGHTLVFYHISMR
jgi:hypothetical protein